VSRALVRPLAVFAAAVLLTLLAALSPLVFRRFEAFRVRRVEVVGARLLPAEEALAVAGIADSLSLFDDLEPWRTRLLGHRLVAGVRFQRRLPGTLRIVVTETQPAALVRGSELRAVDDRGRLLPVELAGARLDIPILAGSARFEGEDSVLARPAAGVVEALAVLRALDAEFAARISEIGAATGGGIRLVMTWSGRPEILLPGVPEPRTLSQIREVLDHVRNGAAGDTVRAPSIDRLARIDARYRDEVFVSFHSR